MKDKMGRREFLLGGGLCLGLGPAASAAGREWYARRRAAAAAATQEPAQVRERGPNPPVRVPVVQTPTANANFATGQQVSLAGLAPRLNGIEPQTARFEITGPAPATVFATLDTPNRFIASWQPLTAGDYTVTLAATYPNAPSIKPGGGTRTLTVESSRIAFTVAQPSLEVLYDSLGGPNTPSGVQPWGWGSSGANTFQFASNAYFSDSGAFSDSRSAGHLLTTGVAQSKTIVRYETVVIGAVDNINISNYRFKLRLWNANVNGGFFGSLALTPNQASQNPNLGGYILMPGSASEVVTISGDAGLTSTGRMKYIRWDNLNIPVPAGVPIQISLQSEHSTSSFDASYQVVYGRTGFASFNADISSNLANQFTLNFQNTALAARVLVN